MLNNVSYEQIAIIMDGITTQTINQTTDYLIDNYGETIELVSESLGEGFTTMGEAFGDSLTTVSESLSEGLTTMGENASEYVLDTFNEVRSNATVFFFETIDINFRAKLIDNLKSKMVHMQMDNVEFIRQHVQQNMIVCVDRVCVFMAKYNINITLLIIVYLVCMLITYKINQLRSEFTRRMEDAYKFIDENEFEHLKMIDESRAELKKLIAAQTSRIKKVADEQVRHSKMQDSVMYERIRQHRHTELLNRICMYLDLFNQYTSGDKFNTLFNLSDEIIYLNPEAEGSIVKKYFIKYLVWNNAAKSQILYPLNLAYAPNVYSETTLNIRTYADSLPANSARRLTQFREEIETNYSELFSFPVVRAPKETQIDFEISVFEYLDECLGGCYKTYNMYCSAGLQ